MQELGLYPGFIALTWIHCWYIAI